jgi:DNA-binding NtrC family response regulator
MKGKILVVDDEKRFLFVLQSGLSRIGDGVVVETANSAEAALQKMEDMAFDLIITDLVMPDMNGVEFTKRVKEIRPQTLVVWMTAHGCQTFESEAKRLDIADCIEKPVEIQEFRKVVRDVMAWE